MIFVSWKVECNTGWGGISVVFVLRLMIGDKEGISQTYLG